MLLKIFTYILVMLNTISTGFNFATMLDYFVYDPTPDNVLLLSKLFIINFYISPIISFSVQIYFIYRLWVVSKSITWLTMTGTLALLCFITGIYVPALVSFTTDPLLLPQATINVLISITRVSSRESYIRKFSFEFPTRFFFSHFR